MDSRDYLYLASSANSATSTRAYRQKLDKWGKRKYKKRKGKSDNSPDVSDVDSAADAADAAGSSNPASPQVSRRKGDAHPAANTGYGANATTFQQSDANYSLNQHGTDVRYDESLLFSRYSNLCLRLQDTGTRNGTPDNAQTSLVNLV